MKNRREPGQLERKRLGRITRLSGAKSDTVEESVFWALHRGRHGLRRVEELGEDKRVSLSREDARARFSRQRERDVGARLAQEAGRKSAPFSGFRAQLPSL
jgi:hypothetical protein